MATATPSYPTPTSPARTASPLPRLLPQTLRRDQKMKREEESEMELESDGTPPGSPPPFPSTVTVKEELPSVSLDPSRSHPHSHSPEEDKPTTSTSALKLEDIYPDPPFSPSPRLPHDHDHSDESASPRKKKKEVKREEVQLIEHLPNAEREAYESFTELKECTYASKALGNLPYYDEDASRCECSWDARFSGEQTEQACGDGAMCMNRLMQIECLSGDCRAGQGCQNQRFQKREYAEIEVVKTERKGFGVRAKTDLVADTFVYEYVGEVIGPTVFAKKMKEYASDGIRHFYFMALDKEVFIDATKKGGLGRFLNHSCNPNCVVAKWTIGKKMRMGIFAKRDIKKGEELTFNYNVDRYGHVAQECYCGEPNCVGFIGGKTQTDIGGMDDLYLDALGIAEEVEALGLRGTKKKKGKQLDDDFTPLLRSIRLEEVPKVSAAVRQAITTRFILHKLLVRIQMTKDAEVQQNLMRLHGFNTMNHILQEYPEDIEIVGLNLDILSRWPLLARNKIESSKIEDSVRSCAKMEDSNNSRMATELLSDWSNLELGYRIPKSIRESGDPADRKRYAETSIEYIAKRLRPNEVEATQEEPSRPAFVKPEASVYSRPELGDRRSTAPNSAAATPPPRPAVALDVNDIIAQAQREAEELAAKDKEARMKAERDAEKKSATKPRAGTLSKEKKVLTLFSAIVVSVMSKYKTKLDPDQFKRRAKEVTQLLCEKEKRHPLYASEPYDTLSPEKAAKIKAYTKEWVKKLIERSGYGRPSPGPLLAPSNPSPSPLRTNPSSDPSPGPSSPMNAVQSESIGNGLLVTEMVEEMDETA